MKIGLIDVDSHNFPNLALMKISSYEKSQGNNVEWWFPLDEYDRVYQAKVFDNTYSKDLEYQPMAKEIIRGGTGYGLDNYLPYEIEHQYPDYSLYDIKDTAYGFLTRGCPRHCKFCIVGDKEGTKVKTTAQLSEFWKGQKNICIMDSNITASKDRKDLFDDLIKSKAWIDFQSGLDIRVLTDEGAEQLNQMKIKMLHFAWDYYEFKTYEKLKEMRPLLRYDMRNIIIYVLTNFNTTHEQDIERIYKLKELNYTPYVMIYDKPNAPRKTKDLQRWCNNRFIFRSCERFEDYKRG